MVRSTQILYYIINLWCPILKSICHHFNHQLPQMSTSKQPIEWQGRSSKAQSQLGGKYGLIHFSNRSPFYDNKCASTISICTTIEYRQIQTDCLKVNPNTTMTQTFFNHKIGKIASMVFTQKITYQNFFSLRYWLTLFFTTNIEVYK